jgi:hypothetical protein
MQWPTALNLGRGTMQNLCRAPFVAEPAGWPRPAGGRPAAAGKGEASPLHPPRARTTGARWDATASRLPARGHPPLGRKNSGSSPHEAEAQTVAAVGGDVPVAARPLPVDGIAEPPTAAAEDAERASAPSSVGLHKRA